MERRRNVDHTAQVMEINASDGNKYLFDVSVENEGDKAESVLPFMGPSGAILERYKGPPKPQGEGGRPEFRKGKREDRRDENRGPKPAFQARPQREERPAKVDPLSPFAKLAALRDQLKK